MFDSCTNSSSLCFSRDQTPYFPQPQLQTQTPSCFLPTVPEEKSSCILFASLISVVLTAPVRQASHFVSWQIHGSATPWIRKSRVFYNTKVHVLNDDKLTNSLFRDWNINILKNALHLLCVCFLLVKMPTPKENELVCCNSSISWLPPGTIVVWSAWSGLN